MIEVPNSSEKFPSILHILAAVLNAKTIVKETLNTQSKNCDQTSFVDAGLKRKHSQNQEQLPICMTSPRNIY
ncbi:8403_t:CDS:2 [Entrophospora sp. SA101]|nr:8403_t:CDS:2 [Entrophospora sp. SA101]CAJ0925504.1 16788_t:CDS:2 [Entrophospora sp. SA101]CAJ0925517.1 16793_t:CDS:2 [Entrophospora sp. SA101]